MTTIVQATTVASAVNPWWADYVKLGMGAALGAVGQSTAAWISKRRPAKAVQAEISDQIAGAFQKLVDELQEENKRLDARIDLLRQESDRRVDLLRQESDGLRNKLSKLQVFAQSLFRHIAALEAQLRGLGVTPADRPDLPDLATLN